MKGSFNMKQKLFSLCSAEGVSGRNCKAAKVAYDLIAQYADEVKTDKFGNLTARMGDKNGKTLLLDAHLDQIGFIITFINEKGFLKLAPCGGVDTRILLGTNVKVHSLTGEINAVISCIPPHLLSAGAEDKSISMKDVWADTGLPADEVKKRISVGDYVTFAYMPQELINGNVTSPALDNRASVAALIRCAELLSKENIKDVNVVFVFSLAEELGGMGAQTAAFTIEPDEAIVVDVSFAKQPGVREYNVGILGKGPMIGISPTLSRNVYSRLFEIAKKSDIPYQTEVMSGSTGTNADDVSASRSGVPTGLISIPQRNMHTQVEIINLNDIENTARLIAEYVLSGGDI